MNDPVTDENLRNTPLRINNRLTKTNQSIIKEMQNLLNLQKIASIRYRNACFQYQESLSQPFKSIYSMEQIISLKESFILHRASSDN